MAVLAAALVEPAIAAPQPSSKTRLAPLVVADRHGRAWSRDRRPPERSPVPYGGDGPPADERSQATTLPVTDARGRSGGSVGTSNLLADSGFTEKWRWTVFGFSPGMAGLAVGDIDGDGSNDVLCTGNGYADGSFAYVLHHDPDGGYTERWAVPGNGYAFARLAQLDDDPALEVVVGSAQDVRVYDGATHALQASLSTGAASLTGLEIADIDDDGAPDVVAIDASDLWVYDLATGSLKALKFGFGGAALALAQVDDDPQLEVVVAGGTGSGLVLDGKTLTVQWGRPSGFGTLLVTGDLDGDGLDEVVTAGTYEDSARVFSPAADSLLYEVQPTTMYASFGAMAIADVTGSSVKELLLSQSYVGIRVIDGPTGLEQWHLNAGGTAIAAGDADDDGTAEILAGGGGDHIGSSALNVYDSLTRTREFQSTDLDGPFYAMDVGDVDHDGRPDVVTSSFESNNGYSDGRYVVLDGADGRPSYLSDVNTDQNWSGVWDLRVANLDDDPQLEICVTSSVLYKGRLICYDGLSHAEQWHVDIPDGLVFSSLEITDVDGDGVLDILAGAMKVHSGAPGCYVYAFHAADGLLLWRTPDLSAGQWREFTYLRVAELDGDPHHEVLAADWRDGFAVISGESGLPQTPFTADVDITAVAVPDSDHNGVAELLVGTHYGTIERRDPTDGTLLETIADGLENPVNGLAVTDLDADGIDDYAFGSGMRLLVRSGADGTTLFTSDVLGIDAGSLDAVKLVQLDDDPDPEVLVNADNGVVVFDGSAVGSLFRDGFETGLTPPWSGSL